MTFMTKTMTKNGGALRPGGTVERKVGNRVTWCSRQLYVTEREGRGCGGCVFWCSQAGYQGECEFAGIPRPAEVGECRAARRSDGRDVWFVTREEYERLKAARRKKREEERSWREFARGFGSSRLGRAAQAEMRGKKQKK